MNSWPSVKQLKLRWPGHASRSSGFAKMIVQSTVKEKRRRGIQKKCWVDNIKVWTGRALLAQLGPLKTGQDGLGML